MDNQAQWTPLVVAGASEVYRVTPGAPDTDALLSYGTFTLYSVVAPDGRGSVWAAVRGVAMRTTIHAPQ